MTEKLPEFFHLVRLEKVASTNEEAINLASVGAASGTIVWASEQTQGRGRHFRKWDSPLGNLYFSIILRPLAPVSSWSQASFISSISVRSGINNLFPELKPKLKWPNDIYLDNKKLGGILLEIHQSALIIGMGINIYSHPENFGTSLSEVGIETTPEKVLHSVAGSFLEWCGKWETEGFSSIRVEWLKHAVGVGKLIEVSLGKQVIPGIFETLDENGALVLKGGQKILAGDIMFEENLTEVNF